MEDLDFLLPSSTTDESRPSRGRHQHPHEFLASETSCHILQMILGHPEHLPSVREIEYMIPASRQEITEELSQLAEKHIVTAYESEGTNRAKDSPDTFWGLTECGVKLLDSSGKAQYIPVLQTLQESVEKPQVVERHLQASRPSLPDRVAESFQVENLDEEELKAAEKDVLGVWSE